MKVISTSGACLALVGLALWCAPQAQASDQPDNQPNVVLTQAAEARAGERVVERQEERVAAAGPAWVAAGQEDLEWVVAVQDREWEAAARVDRPAA